MEISAISIKPASFKGEEGTSVNTNRKSPLTTEKIVAAGVAGTAALDAGKKGTLKFADKAEAQLKEFATDFMIKNEEGAETVKETAGNASQAVKKGLKGAISKVGDSIKKFRNTTLPKFAKDGFTSAQKNSLKWIGGVGAAIVATLAILRDKDKDGRLDIIEAFDALLHPDKVSKEEE